MSVIGVVAADAGEDTARSVHLCEDIDFGARIDGEHDVAIPAVDAFDSADDAIRGNDGHFGFYVIGLSLDTDTQDAEVGRDICGDDASGFELVDGMMLFETDEARETCILLQDALQTDIFLAQSSIFTSQGMVIVFGMEEIDIMIPEMDRISDDEIVRTLDSADGGEHGTFDDGRMTAVIVCDGEIDDRQDDTAHDDCHGLISLQQGFHGLILRHNFVEEVKFV